jgi:hypothetical protein
VGLGLQCAAGCGGAGIDVVDKDDTVSNEDLVFDYDAFAHKRVARDLAAAANTRILLNLDERADFGFVANFAAVKIDERSEPHVLPEFHVIRNGLKLTHDSFRVQNR